MDAHGHMHAPVLQLLLLKRMAHRGEVCFGSHAWVFYGDVWESFRPRIYWWASIKELRKLALILVLDVTQVRVMICRGASPGLELGCPSTCSNTSHVQDIPCMVRVVIVIVTGSREEP